MVLRLQARNRRERGKGPDARNALGPMRRRRRVGPPPAGEPALECSGIAEGAMLAAWKGGDGGADENTGWVISGAGEVGALPFARSVPRRRRAVRTVRLPGPRSGHATHLPFPLSRPSTGPSTRRSGSGPGSGSVPAIPWRGAGRAALCTGDQRSPTSRLHHGAGGNDASGAPGFRTGGAQARVPGREGTAMAVCCRRAPRGPNAR